MKIVIYNKDGKIIGQSIGKSSIELETLSDEILELNIQDALEVIQEALNTLVNNGTLTLSSESQNKLIKGFVRHNNAT